MKTLKKTLKAIVLSIVLSAGMLPANAMAQEDTKMEGGLFGLGERFNSEGMFRDAGAQLIENEDALTNADFGEEAPLGSGIAIMLAAGLGYVALKKKEDKQ